MSELEFAKFKSIKRLNRKCVITEKLDGTNAQINFNKEGEILCGSRKRVITPDRDNYGFANWAHDNQEELFNVLGEGRHYGEWWGSGIQRRYGKTDGDKVFSLFNSSRWLEKDLKSVDQLSVVPVVYEGGFWTEEVENAMTYLHESGSLAAPGFKKPEGIVVYHSQIDQMFKVTFEHDSTGKPYGS